MKNLFIAIMLLFSQVATATIPVDPGTGITDNSKTPIKVSGVTGLHARFEPLYDMFAGQIGSDNMSPSMNSVINGVRRPGELFNVGFFKGGTGTGTITIKQASGNSFADTDGNRGYLWLRSATDGSIIRGKITADVSLSPVGAPWGAGTKGDLSSAILRVYAINDGNSANDFTPKWGLGYQAGFQKIRSTQDSTTATDINLPQEIFVNSNVTNDNSPMSDVGYMFVNFDDTGNANGEDFWTFTEAHPGESADGIWQEYNAIETGFSGGGPNSRINWTMLGATAQINYTVVTEGNSNSTAYTVELPIQLGGPIQKSAPLFGIKDNGSIESGSGQAIMAGVGDTLCLLSRPSGANWTAAGTKRADFNITYQSYQP